jgi:hypothetical protein
MGVYFSHTAQFLSAVQAEITLTAKLSKYITFFVNFAINNQHLNILGIIPPSESDRFIDYGVKGKIAGYGQLVPYKVSAEEEFHSMYFSLIVFEAADS